MKILLDKYPMGSLPNQKSAGRYIDDILYENLKILARNITKDLTYLGVCTSSTLEVGAGKSTLVSQIGEAYTDLVNQYHKLNLTFDMKNCVFRPKELIKRAFELPRYSFIFLDEWEDLHYWSELGITLRTFFRKCRQLNLFIMIIIPNFFQLGINYAVTRSLFLIDVKYEGEFERGHFRFFDYDKKKKLFIEGKKTQNYYASTPNFERTFTNGYGVPEKEYRELKYKDMVEAEDRGEEQNKKIKKQHFIILCNLLYKEFELNPHQQEELLKRYGVKISYKSINQIIYHADKGEEKKILENPELVLPEEI